ncbi:hypothetical protein NPIL_99531 [Nephila pilipes]|uniref:Uncharacterized protein n=1 Tax=Nephila pilipes TaxID=299642 RepID=A0A8X6P370_NEPPI|nr:hypothetical protein NPIL_99531 [Nephila pilipes]
MPPEICSFYCVGMDQVGGRPGGWAGHGVMISQGYIAMFPHLFVYYIWQALGVVLFRWIFGVDEFWRRSQVLPLIRLLDVCIILSHNACHSESPL